jgi:hypothetical protein
VFGKDAPAHEQASEDEDWGPGKRKRREKESNAASTLMTLCESKKKSKSDETIEGMMNLPPQTRRPIFRLPPDAVEVVVSSTPHVSCQTIFLCSLSLKDYLVI